LTHSGQPTDRPTVVVVVVDKSDKIDSEIDHLYIRTLRLFFTRSTLKLAAADADDAHN